MPTIYSIANTSTMAGLAGSGALQSSSSTLMSKSEAQAMAIGQVAEMNIIQPKDNKPGIMMMDRDDDKGPGLNRQTYNALGRLGQMTAMTRAGVNSGSLMSAGISLKV